MIYFKEKMMKIRILLAIFFSLFVFFSNALAANLYFSKESGEIKKGDTIVVYFKISSDDEKINVADCSILFNKNVLQVVGISTGDSIFNLWTRTPVFSNDNGKIIFTGGSTDGFQGKNGEILKIIFTAKERGNTNLTITDDSFLYLSDGKGTKIQPSKESLSIAVVNGSGAPKDEWHDILINDKMPPSNIEIKLAKDPSVFDNKLFISFSAIDDGSGIKSYEVKEGNSDFVETESPYVLKDQKLRGDVILKVTDKSGNYKIVKLERPIYTNSIFWIVIIVIALVLIYFSFKMKIVKKNKWIKKFIK